MKELGQGLKTGNNGKTLVEDKVRRIRAGL
jgi:hypothetical protein